MKTPLFYQNTLSKILFYCLVFFVAFISNAQEEQDFAYTNTPLIDIIQELQKEHTISFSFASDAIAGKKVSLEIEGITWIEFLDILEAHTGLVFKKISDTQVIITPRAHSTKICGYLIDEQTQFPLAYTAIMISKNTQVITDATGFFAFAKADSDSYTISVPRYKDINFTPTEGCSQVYVSLSDEALDEIIITGYVTSGIDRNKDGSLDVTQRTLGILPGLVTPDLLQSIQLIPGINTLDESASGIQIRGGSPDQNLILFDDIKLFNSGYFYGMFSAFNPYATEKARIYKSGTSAAYGDRVSGIIDISTGEKIPEKATYGVGIDGLSIDGYIKTPLSKKAALYVFARRSYTDIVKSLTYDGYAEKIFRNSGVVRDSNGNILTIENDDNFDIDSSENELSFYDINAKVIFHPTAKDKLALSTLFTRNGIDFSFTNSGETKIDSLVTQNNGISLNWKHKSSATSKQEISAYFSNYKSHYNNIEIVADVLEETNIRENTITDIGLNFESSHTINERHSYAFGYQLSNTDVSIDLIKDEPADPEDNLLLIENEHNFKNALFGEYTYKTKRSGLLGAGVRFVHYTSIGELYVEPRLNLEQALTEELRVKASIERRHQPISQLIEFNQTELRLENNIWRLSDDETYPLLQSDQISAGLLFDKGGWTIDVDGYYKELKGLTSFTNGFSTPQPELSEGESRIRGIDILLKKRINNYRIWAGYTYNNIEYTFPEIQVGRFPGNNDITHSFRISNTLKVNDFQFSLGWQYRTGEPFTPITSFDPDNQGIVTFGDLNSDRLQDYHRLDASAIYNFKLKEGKDWRGQFGISVLNIYNRRIPISITHRSDIEDFGLQLEQVIQRFSLGITPNASFRLFF